MDIFSPTFGREVKSRLAYLEMSQRDLAKLIGKTQAYINDIINDRRGAPEGRRAFHAERGRKEIFILTITIIPERR